MYSPTSCTSNRTTCMSESTCVMYQGYVGYSDSNPKEFLLYLLFGPDAFGVSRVTPFVPFNVSSYMVDRDSITLIDLARAYQTYIRYVRRTLLETAGRNGSRRSSCSFNEQTISTIHSCRATTLGGLVNYKRGTQTHTHTQNDKRSDLYLPLRNT